MKWLLIFGVLALAIGAWGCSAFRSNVFETGSPLQASSGSVALLNEKLLMDELPAGWAHRTFFRVTPTQYRIVEEDGRRALRCTTDHSGSILARETSIPVADLPFLSWSWKITKPIDSLIDEDTKEGDDHPARFFLRFENDSGERFHTEIIWSNLKYAPGDFKLIGEFYHLVANGLPANVGSWHSQTVNLSKLYKDIGGSGAPMLKVLGFFCDSDDTGGASTAFFSDVTLSSGLQLTFLSCSAS